MIKLVLAAALVAIVGALSFTLWQTREIESANPPQGNFVSLPGGGRLHFTERQPISPAKATVLLLHGASGNQADLMLALGDRLAAQGFRVIAIDRPGHGWSDRPDGAADASPERQAELIVSALRRLGVAEAVVVGHSWAGALAAEIALRYPDFTRGLVLLSPVLHPWTTGVSWYYGAAVEPVLGPLFTHLLIMPVGLASLDAGIGAVFDPQATPPDYARRTGVRLLLRPDEFRANAQDVLALLDFVTGLAPKLASITAPTAIVAGDADRIVSTEQQARRGALEIPGARLLILPGVGHSPHWADPEAVVSAIVDVAKQAKSPAPLATQSP